MIKTIIKGTGHYLPNKIIYNNDFINNHFYDKKGIKIKKSNNEIIKKFHQITGIEERRYIDNNLSNSDIATIAGKKAINNAKIDKEKLDYIIAAHNYGDINIKYKQTDIMPSISAKIKNKLGIKNIKCKPYDMIFGCAGWVEGVILANQLIKSNFAKNILVTGSDTLSRAIDIYDINSMIFSDGAGAVILSGQKTTQNIGILHYDSRSDNEEHLNYLFNGPSLNKKSNNILKINMNGKKIYEYAIQTVPIMLKTFLQKNAFNINDIKKIFLHQANEKMDYAILNRLLKLYKISKNNEKYAHIMPMTIKKLGNSSVATIPTLIDIVLKGQLPPHKIKSGDNILISSLGASMNINAIIYRFP